MDDLKAANPGIADQLEELLGRGLLKKFEEMSRELVERNEFIARLVVFLVEERKALAWEQDRRNKMTDELEAAADGAEMHAGFWPKFPTKNEVRTCLAARLSFLLYHRQCIVAIRLL